jgi:hypothetical protein
MLCIVRNEPRVFVFAGIYIGNRQGKKTRTEIS